MRSKRRTETFKLRCYIILSLRAWVLCPTMVDMPQCTNAHGKTFKGPRSYSYFRVKTVLEDNRAFFGQDRGRRNKILTVATASITSLFEERRTHATVWCKSVTNKQPRHSPGQNASFLTSAQSGTLLGRSARREVIVEAWPVRSSGSEKKIKGPEDSESSQRR